MTIIACKKNENADTNGNSNSNITPPKIDVTICIKNHIKVFVSNIGYVYSDISDIYFKKSSYTGQTVSGISGVYPDTIQYFKRQFPSLDTYYYLVQLQTAPPNYPKGTFSINANNDTITLEFNQQY